MMSCAEGRRGHSGPQTPIKGFCEFWFLQVKQYGKKATKKRAIEMYGVSRWIGNRILPNVDLLKFEIGLPEAFFFLNIY